MTAKNKPSSTAPDAPAMRIHMKVMTEEKTVVVNISDVLACARAEGVNSKDAVLLSELHDLLIDIHDAAPDATAIELTPETVAKVLDPPEEEKIA